MQCDTSTNAPPVAQGKNLDLLRGKLLIQLYALGLNVNAVIFDIEHELDDALEGTMGAIRQRAKDALTLGRSFIQAKTDAAISIEANVEWRADRDRRRA